MTTACISMSNSFQNQATELANTNYSRKLIIQTSIIRTVDYMNTRVSIVARATLQYYIIMPLNLFTLHCSTNSDVFDDLNVF